MTHVLLAGATGNLGNAIATQLVAQPDTALTILVRAGWRSDERKSAAITALVDAGATVAEGDVRDHESLRRATENINVVVSSLQGGDEVIRDGQIALARAAAANGATRFIPSDFAIDLFHAPQGAPQFDARRAADTEIATLDLQMINVLQGGFMEGLVNLSYRGLFDLHSRTYRFWGTGDEQFDLTTLPDTAAFTARVATNEKAAAGVHAISGSRTSFNEIAHIIEELSGVKLEPHSLGDEADLRAAIVAKGGSWGATMEWYFLSMLSTPPLLRDEHHTYADLRPTTIREHLQRELEKLGL